MSSRVLHPSLDAAERRRLLVEGVELFRGGRYYDCHEVWEEVWRSNRPEPRDLLRGLIQITVGMYHFVERRRPDVAARVLARGRGRVEAFAPQCLGLDLARLSADVSRWEVWLDSIPDEPAIDLQSLVWPAPPRLEVKLAEALC